jgi:D-beta-D-heptose 7-phosphate kinase/D-beta-D-heptose 1-phosphate adenosyltransferase
MNPKVLVVGDMIYDEYIFGTATRLCPEAPVPVFVPGSWEVRDGGAGLVARQLRALGAEPTLIGGSASTKIRYFVDGHLLLRVDQDRQNEESFNEDEWRVKVLQDINLGMYSAVVVSDYDKGTFHGGFAGDLIWRCDLDKVPIFVDSKKNWEWYKGASFFFPNENETLSFFPGATLVIQKLGARGASVNGEIIPPFRSHAVKDTTGAGDTFLAAFVYSYVKSAPTTNPRQHVEFANRVAGLSVEHIGTHVVTKEELDKSYGV